MLIATKTNNINALRRDDDLGRTGPGGGCLLAADLDPVAGDTTRDQGVAQRFGTLRPTPLALS